MEFKSITTLHLLKNIVVHFIMHIQKGRVTIEIWLWDFLLHICYMVLLKFEYGHSNALQK